MYLAFKLTLDLYYFILNIIIYILFWPTGDKLAKFLIRVYWLKAKQHQFLSETLDAVDCYEITAELLQQEREQKNQKQGIFAKKNKKN